MASSTPQDPQDFEPPPGNGGQGAPPTDEDAGVEFQPPPAGEPVAAQEQAGVLVTPDALQAVPAELMEARDAIEQQLWDRVAARAQVEEAAAPEALQGPENLQGVAIGLGDAGIVPGATRGEPGVPALTVYLADSAPPPEVESIIVESMGVRAAASDAVTVNPVVTGIIDAQPHRFRARPAPGGISVAHPRVTAGTIGGLARGRTAPRNSRLLVLSNNHVLANSNNAVFGDCVSQPGPADTGACPADQIATLERFVPINFGGGVNYVDCATGWAWPDRVRRELAYLSGGVQQNFRIGSAPVAPYLGMPVGKSGRTTQLTTGRITGIGASVNINYNGRLAFFRDQIEIQAYSGLFSQGGDSGSSIWTWNAPRNPVGLLFAGGGGVTFANPITQVLTALDIALYT